MQLMNCVPLIPIKNTFGRFDVRILSMWNVNIQMLAEVLHRKLYLKNNKMKFIDLWSEFTPKYVPNRVIYKLNDINEAGASVISHIILDYVKLPLEGDYTTQNKRIKKRIRSSTSTPGSMDKQQSQIPKPLEQNILMAIFNHWHF